MNAIIDRTGERFGAVVVIGRAPAVSGKRARWLYRCDCGTEKDADGRDLAKGHVQSCGCRFKGKQKHYASRDRTYSAWSTMKYRCQSPTSPAYHRYGGRGIKVCDEWLSYARFVDDMGPRPVGATIDRIDNDGPYAPWNCRWSTRKEQAQNRSTNVFLEHEGRRQTLAQWADEAGLPRGVFYHRAVSLKWDIARALSEPVRKLRRA